MPHTSPRHATSLDMDTAIKSPQSLKVGSTGPSIRQTQDPPVTVLPGRPTSPTPEILPLFTCQHASMPSTSRLLTTNTSLGGSPNLSPQTHTPDNKTTDDTLKTTPIPQSQALFDSQDWEDLQTTQEEFSHPFRELSKSAHPPATAPLLPPQMANPQHTSEQGPSLSFQSISDSQLLAGCNHLDMGTQLPSSSLLKSPNPPLAL